jgi:hypothetical protein
VSPHYFVGRGALSFSYKHPLVYVATIIAPASTTSAEGPIAIGTMLGDKSGVTSTCA